MTDRHDDEQDDEEYEVDRVVTREDGAATLRRLADGVEDGSITLTDDHGVTVAVPDQFELEVEYEAEDDQAELEVELEWPMVDGEAVAAEPDSDLDEDTDEIEADDSVEDADDSVDVVGVAGKASKAQFELYQDRASEWRWRLVHNNGNIIADSGEGYNRKATARKGLKSVMRNAPGATVVEQPD